MNFDDWFYEMEGFGFRAERFWSDYDTKNELAMKIWLRTAYEMGYQEAKNEFHT